MIVRGFGKRRGGSGFEPPIELRFVDLFMIIVTALMFTTVILSIISAFVGGVNVDVVPRVLTKAIPRALANESYELTLAATGGSGSYNWEIVEGQLPEDLQLRPTEGMIIGIPKRAQRTQFVVRVKDSQGKTDSANLDMEVYSTTEATPATTPSIYVTARTVLLPDATGKQSYRTELSANGGIPPYRWKLTQGQVPAGLFLSAEGLLAGTPTEWDSPKTFTVTVMDAIGSNATQNLKLWINPPPLPLWRKILSWALSAIWVIYFIWLARFYWKGGRFEFRGIQEALRTWRDRRR